MSGYDVFITFKNTDAEGEKTKDYYMADSLYKELDKNGVKVFFSPVSIRKNAVYNYSEYIDKAIEESDILIAVGTCAENLNAKWVSYEITSFRNEYLSGRKDEARAGMISYVSEDVRVENLPLCLRSCEMFTGADDVVKWVKNRIRSAGGITARFDRDKDKSNVTVIIPGEYLFYRYRILKEIGRGGMSTVYLAYDEVQDKNVAVKAAFRKTLGMSVDFNIIIKSLYEEVDIMRRLDDPAFPKIYDVAESPDVMIIVMDYVEGVNLGSMIDAQGRIPEDQVIDTGIKLCRALSSLHMMSPPVIYRDMKPSNVMIRPDGNIAMIDFGTAREYKENSPADTVCLGTVGYAAPEQFGGMGQTDIRTDIYGLGVTLYHMVTGMNPKDPPYEIKPIREVDGKLSKKLEFIINKAVKRDPNDRYQSADEMLVDLNKLKKTKDKGNSFFSKLFKDRKESFSETESKPQRSVPQTVEKKMEDIMPSLIRTGYVPGSGDTSVLGADLYPETQDLLQSEKEQSAASALSGYRIASVPDTKAAVCISVPDSISAYEESGIYIYFFTSASREKVENMILESKLGDKVVIEKLFSVPADSVISVRLITDRVRFNKPKVEFMWNGSLCFCCIKTEKILSEDKRIPVEAVIETDGANPHTVSFELLIKTETRRY